MTEPSDLTMAFLEASLEIDAEEAEKPKREWTDKQKAAARSMVERYEAHCEMLWEERVFELGLKLGLEEEDAEALVDDVR